jgi:type I restriction enzyme S subunit
LKLAEVSVNSDIMQSPEWTLQPLGTCADVLDARRKPVNARERANRAGAIPYYGATGQVGWIDDYLFDEQLVLVGEDGAPFFDKTKPIAYIIEGKSWVNNHAHVLRARPDVTTNRYLKYFLDSFDFTGYVQGSTRDKLTQGSMNSIPVPIAPREIQARLVDFVESVGKRRSSADAHLGSSRRAVEQLRHVISASACSGGLSRDWRDENVSVTSGDQLLAAADERRREQLGRRYREPELNKHALEIELPDGWSLAPLGILLEGIKYGTSKKSLYNSAGVPVLRIPNVSSGHVDLSDLKYSQLTQKEIQDLALRASDLLMIRSNGSPQLVGRSTVVGSEGQGMAYAGYLMRLRADTEVCDPSYLALALASPDLRNQVEMPLRSTSGVNNINTDEVRGLAVPLPPLAEQHEIAYIANQLLRLGDSLADRLDSAKAAIDSSSRAVLAKAFRGELAAG